MQYRGMFTSSFELCCHIHNAIVDEIIDTIKELDCPPEIYKPILVESGYTNLEIGDAIRVITEGDPLEQAYDEVIPYESNEYIRISPLLRREPEVLAWLSSLKATKIGASA